MRDKNVFLHLQVKSSEAIKKEMFNDHRAWRNQLICIILFFLTLLENRFSFKVNNKLSLGHLELEKSSSFYSYYQKVWISIEIFLTTDTNCNLSKIICIKIYLHWRNCKLSLQKKAWADYNNQTRECKNNKKSFNNNTSMLYVDLINGWLTCSLNKKGRWLNTLTSRK